MYVDSKGTFRTSSRLGIRTDSREQLAEKPETNLLYGIPANLNSFECQVDGFRGEDYEYVISSGDSDEL